MAAEPHLAGGAKNAAHSAANLGADAGGGAALKMHLHSFNGLVVAEAQQKFAGVAVAAVGGNGRLAFASYQPFVQLTVVGTYPLISAETAWQGIQDGIDEDTLFSISPATADGESLPALPSGFKYWRRAHQSRQEVHLYTFPTVFLPVDEGLPPLIYALNYTVQTDAETSRALAEQVGVNVHFWGILDTTTNSLAVAGWEPMTDLNPLIKNGTIQRQKRARHGVGDDP